MVLAVVRFLIVTSRIGWCAMHSWLFVVHGGWYRGIKQYANNYDRAQIKYPLGQHHYEISFRLMRYAN